MNNRIKSLTESFGINEDDEEEEASTSIRQVILQSKGVIAVESWGGPGGDHWSYNWHNNKGLMLKQIVVVHGSECVCSLMFRRDENGIMESSQIFGCRRDNPSKNYAVPKIAANQTPEMAEAAISNAISKIIEQGIFLYGVDDQVRELVTELKRMRCFLKDVDARRQREERVRNWADEIRELAQDAEAMVDKYADKDDTAYCFCTMLARALKKVAARYMIGWDIGKINKRIKSLTESLTTYGIVGINEGDATSIPEVLQINAITIERWGGHGGKPWSYNWPDKSLLKQIVVKHGEGIESIMFTTIQEENGIMESSKTFGGTGGKLAKIDIDCPKEYLTGISGTIGRCESYIVIKSIKFHTNLRNYSPTGTVEDTMEETDTSFSFMMQGGVVVGFHGCSGGYLDSIGLYVVQRRPTLAQGESYGTTS